MFFIKARGAFLFRTTMQGLIIYLKNVRAELKHVVWPSNRQAMTHVVLILLISAFATAFIAGLDYLFTQGAALFINR